MLLAVRVPAPVPRAEEGGVVQTTTIRESYEREGYVIVPDAIDAELVGEARAHVEWLQERHPDTSPEHLFDHLEDLDPFWYRLVADDRLLDIAEAFIGSDIALFATGYISKPPFSGRPVLWHQDGSYWPLEPMDVVSLWLAVDDATVENGCLRVIPGSHSLDIQPFIKRDADASVLGSEIDPSLVDERLAVDLELAAGSVEVHHPNIIHGSNANASPHRRCGLTIRYIPTTTRITSTGRQEKAYLLRGSARPGINAYRERPRCIPGDHMPFRGSDSFA